ncbi:MAG: DUF6538 domain-containing protein [Rhodanobacter sp.]
MRLAYHLLRHPSGVWHFRLAVPADLREAFGLRMKTQLRIAKRVNLRCPSSPCSCGGLRFSAEQQSLADR